MDKFKVGDIVKWKGYTNTFEIIKINNYGYYRTCFLQDINFKPAKLIKTPNEHDLVVSESAIELDLQYYRDLKLKKLLNET